MNNKVLTAYCAFLTAAVIFLSIKVLGESSPSQKKSEKTNESVATRTAVSIAYVNIDTLMFKYKYTKEYNDEVYAKKNAIEIKYENLANAWKKKAMQYQEKARMGTLSAQEIQGAEQSLGMEQEGIVKNREKELADLMEKDAQNNKKFTEEVNAFIKEYNKDGKYKYIFSYVKNGNMLYADETSDITNDIVNGLNARYKK